MKVIAGSSKQTAVSQQGKSMKILQHLRLLANHTNFEEMPSTSKHCDNSNTSCESDFVITNGSFSKIKPIGTSRKLPNPIATSTPKYEDISQYEESDHEDTAMKLEVPPITISTQKYEDITDSDENESDVTFNHFTDVAAEKESCNEYITELKQFIKRSNGFVQKKQRKKLDILKKLKKYQKKIARVQQALDNINQAILIGSKVAHNIDEL